jgi:hypothetical protein
VAHDTRTLKISGLTVAGIVALLCVAAALGYRAGRTPADAPGAAAPATAGAAPIEDAPGFIQAISGSWQSPDEQLSIHSDKGVVEILRQARLKNGEVQMDQYVAAPVRLEPEQRRLELETPDGRWLVKLIPGERRAQLSVTYPDKRHVLYE